MRSLNVVFSHGQESGPWGTKIKALASVAESEAATATSVDYRGIADPGERVNKLLAQCSGGDSSLLLVGSSMGGHVAAAAAGALKPEGLFVLAPAFYMPGYEALTPVAPACPLAIVHGWHDEVVPVENSIRYARAANATLHVLDGDHRLTARIDTIGVLFREFIRTVRRTMR